MITKLSQILEEAKNKKLMTLAVAAADDRFVLKAVAKAKSLCLIKPILIGDSQRIRLIADEIGFPVDEREILHEPDSRQACIKAVEMASNGNAEILMKGLVSTGTFLKQIVSKKHELLNSKFLSHLAIFESPNYHKLLGITDAAMNIAPNIDEKTIILQNAIKVFHSLGIKPKVAILAATEKVNPKISATTDAIALIAASKNGVFEKCQIDGPFALDNAISLNAANHKGIKSLVAGDADLLLVPDINSGNILYKSLSFLGNAKCAAIIAGSKIPIVLTSRADSEETKFLSIALAILTTS